MIPPLDPVPRTVLRGALAVLFLWAAAHKLRDRAAFRRALADYRLLPAGAVAPAAGLLIAAELGTAATLLLPGSGAGPSLCAAAILGTYAAAVAANLARGRRHIDCGCAGAAARRRLSGGLVARNLALAAAALLSAPPPAPRSLGWLDAATVAAAVTALAFLYAAAEALPAAIEPPSHRATTP